MTTRRMGHRGAVWLAAGCLSGSMALAACSTDGAGKAEPGAGAANETGGAAADSPAGGAAGELAGQAAGSLYVVANEVYANDESTSYVSLLTSLDITSLDLGNAIEFPGGRANIATRAGWVFVSPPTSPEIRRFRVSAAGKLAPDGVVSFLNYGLDSISLDDWGNSFISDTKAYAHNPVDGTTVVWNPTSMTIEGEVDVSDFELVRPTLGELNGSSGVVRGNRLFRTLFWSNWDDERTSELQYLAVYDTDANKLIALEEETRCPGLSNIATQDEAGNAYFSNWIYNVGETLLREGPKSCALRLPADSEHFDPDFRFDYASVADGREGAVFNYLGDGQGVMSIFYPEQSPTTAETTPIELVSVPAWKVWSVDLAGKAAPLPGLDFMLGAITPLRFGGRSFLMVPGEEWSIIHVHEIVDGKAVPRFDIPGWSYQLLQVR